MIQFKQLIEDLVTDNTCIHCGNIVDENLKKWFSDKWVNIGKKKKGGGKKPIMVSTKPKKRKKK